MKRKIILILISAAIIAIGVPLTLHILSFKRVHVSLTGDDYTVIIKNPDDEELAKLTTTSDISLQEGEYSYTIQGQKYDTSHAIAFTVAGNDTSITIKPDYSAATLASLATGEEAAITNAIESSYSSDDDTLLRVRNVALHKRGEWATAIIESREDRRDLPMRYRVVLESKLNGWEIIVPPTIAIRHSDHPSVPMDVLNSLYPAAL